MTEGKPLKLLVSFALPLMFGNIFQQLYTVVDTAIVGRGVGMNALAAVGTVDWLNWMFLSVALLNLIAVTTSERVLRVRTISADSIAISVPAPIAIPTSAATRAGASFIPSPTIITVPLC